MSPFINAPAALSLQPTSLGRDDRCSYAEAEYTAFVWMGDSECQLIRACATVRVELLFQNPLCLYFPCSVSLVLPLSRQPGLHRLARLPITCRPARGQQAGGRRAAGGQQAGSRHAANGQWVGSKDEEGGKEMDSRWAAGRQQMDRMVGSR